MVNTRGGPRPAPPAVQHRGRRRTTRVEEKRGRKEGGNNRRTKNKSRTEKGDIE